MTTQTPAATLLDLAREAVPADDDPIRATWQRVWTMPFRVTRTASQRITRRGLQWRLRVVRSEFANLSAEQLACWSAAEMPFLPPDHDGSRLNRALRDLWAIFGGKRMNRWLRKCLRLEKARRETP